jgi:hypothetical protein
MNSVVIIFVLNERTQQDFATPLHKLIAALETREASLRSKPEEIQTTGSEELPFWTWLLLNPCP